MLAFGRWSTVRAFGSVKYFNISYAVLVSVPVVHALYSMTAPLTTFFGAPAPFPDTLRWIYGASFAFALGIILYQLRCPAIIKRFGTDTDKYLEAEYESYRRALPSHRLSIVIANLDRDLDRAVYEQIQTLLERRDKAIASDRAAAQKELDEIIDQQHADAVQRYLLKNYERLNESDPVCRLASLGLYLAGTGILLILFLCKSYNVFFT
jgi:hypothetical protein